MRFAVLLLVLTSACVTLRPYVPPAAGEVSCGADGDDVVLANERIHVRIDRRRGRIESIEIDGRRVAGAEQLFGVRPSPSARVEIGASTSFYARVGTRVALDDVIVERTYELTRGPYLYVQVLVRPRSKAARLDRFAWSLADADVDIAVTAPATLVLEPTGELGGLDKQRSGTTLTATIGEGRWSLDASTIELEPDHILAFGVAVSHGEPARDLRPRPLDEFPFYVGLGMRAPAWHGAPGYTFVNWNRFEDLGALLPIRGDVVAEDALIRTSMHLLERVERDDGWPRTFAWSVYPDADWQAAHVGALLPLLSTWAHLEHVRGRRDARTIYDVLQGAYPILASALQDRTEEGVPYIAYSAKKKQREGGPSGVLNTHARGVQFAAAMREAAESIADRETAERWGALVVEYHAGTRTLLSGLYPGQQNGVRLFGWVDYAFSLPRVSTTGGSSYYPRASIGGIAASYESAETWEPWFVDVVDEHSRVSANPLAPPAAPIPWAPHALRLARAFPPALAFLSGAKCRVNRFEVRPVSAPTRAPAREVDFDGDGRPDRLMLDRGNAESVTASVALGDGVALAWARFEPGDVPIATGDFDGDGRTDLFAVVRDDKLKREDAWVALSDGQRFSPAIWSVMPPDAAWSIADVDQDGRDDVLLGDDRALASVASKCPSFAPTPMSANVTLVGPGELLAYARLDGGVRTHDPARYVRDPKNGRWIRTNNPFAGSWATGYWEEVDAAAVPASGRFEVTVSDDAIWAAHREDTTVYFAADRAADVEVESAACADVRRYRRGVWSSPQRTAGRTVRVERKDIVRFELDGVACGSTGRGPS